MSCSQLTDSRISNLVVKWYKNLISFHWNGLHTIFFHSCFQFFFQQLLFLSFFYFIPKVCTIWTDKDCVEICRNRVKPTSDSGFFLKWDESTSATLEAAHWSQRSLRAPTSLSNGGHEVFVFLRVSCPGLFWFGQCQAEDGQQPSWTFPICPFWNTHRITGYIKRGGNGTQ